MFADLPAGVALGFRVVEPDRQFEHPMRVDVRRNIDIHSDLTFGTGVTDAAEDPFDDVDVMLSAI